MVYLLQCYGITCHMQDIATKCVISHMQWAERTSQEESRNGFILFIGN